MGMCGEECVAVQGGKWGKGKKDQSPCGWLREESECWDKGEENDNRHRYDRNNYDIFFIWCRISN